MEQSDKKTSWKRLGKIALITIIGFIGLLFLISLGDKTNKEATNDFINDIHKQVSADAVDQYNIAKRQGDKIQICVQAGLVSAAYLQEKNEASYNEWKAVEKEDCQKAGIPR